MLPFNKHLVHLCSFFLVLNYSFAQPEDSSGTAIPTADCDSLYNQALQAFSQDEIAQTIQFIEQAQSCYQSFEAWGDYIKSLNGLSSIYYMQDDFEKFREGAFAAHAESVRHLESTHKQYADALNNVNSYYGKIGNHDKSIEYIQQSLQIKEQNKEPKIELAISFQNLGNAYRNNGDYKKATDYLRKALEYTLDSLSENHHRVAQLYDNIGLVYQKAGEVDSALVYCEKAWSLLAPQKVVKKSRAYNISIQVLQRLGELELIKGASTKANYYIQQALDRQSADNAYRKYKSFELRSKIWSKEQQYDKALAALEKAKAIAGQHRKGSTPPAIARRALLMAEVYGQLNRTDEALVKYQEALEVLAPGFTNEHALSNPSAKEIVTRQEGLNVLHQKARLLWSLYETKGDSTYLFSALNTFEIATQLISEIRWNIQTEEAKNTLSEQSIQIFEEAINAAFEAHRISGKTALLEKAFALAENNKAQFLLESINEQAAKGFSDLPDSLLEKEKNIRLTQAYLQRQLLKNSKEQKTKQLKDQLFAENLQLERLNRLLEENYPRYYNAKYENDAVDIARLQQELSKTNSALLEFFIGEHAVYLFLITGGAEIELFKIVERNRVLEEVEKMKRLLYTPPASTSAQADYNQFVESSSALYDLLLKASIESLPPTITSLLVIPDFQLNYLPFELLIQNRPAAGKPSFKSSQLAYVLNSYNLSYDYSATLFSRNQEVEKRNFAQSFIGFAPSFPQPANAVTRSCTAAELSDLQCNSEEVSAINTLMKGQIQLHEAANSANFEMEAGNYQVIHLATHACIDESNPLLNKIFLSDNYLSNKDLYNLNLKAELAVLSACNTGGGKLIKGEGVMSLARGFFSAGCASTVMSMWAVDDCATSDIMLGFYEQLKKGKPKNEALRMAKLAYLEQVEKTKTHPYYWAAFVQFGNRDALHLSNSIPWYYFLAGVLALLLGVFYFRSK